MLFRQVGARFGLARPRPEGTRNARTLQGAIYQEIELLVNVSESRVLGAIKLANAPMVGIAWDVSLMWITRQDRRLLTDNQSRACRAELGFHRLIDVHNFNVVRSEVSVNAGDRFRGVGELARIGRLSPRLESHPGAQALRKAKNGRLIGTHMRSSKEDDGGCCVEDVVVSLMLLSVK